MSIIISYNLNSAKEIAKKSFTLLSKLRKSTSNNFFIKENQHQIISSNSITSNSWDIGYVGISKECEVTLWQISEFDLGDIHFM